MEGDISGIILIVAFAAVATSGAVLMLRLWRASSAGSPSSRSS
jgi:hypothetical protein